MLLSDLLAAHRIVSFSDRIESWRAIQSWMYGPPDVYHVCEGDYSPHCRFDGDFCTTAQVPLAVEERLSGEQRQANQLITSPLCPQRQTADSWLLFNFRAMPLGEKAKAAWQLRTATMKGKQWSGDETAMPQAAGGRLAWNQPTNQMRCSVFNTFICLWN